MNAQLQEIADRIDTTVDELLAFLDSPSGRRLRKYRGHRSHRLRSLVMRMPWLRRTPIGKLIELGGGAALVVKFAEMIRDWEREQEAMAPPQVIDVPPARPV